MEDERDVVIECSMVDSDWQCRVELRGMPEGRSYLVGVSRAELSRFAPGHFDPTMLVAQSFTFLLDRESPDSILRVFDISDIERYFPEFDVEIARLMRP